MIGEFLSKITLLHTAIIAVVSSVALIAIAYKKPKFYKTTSRILVIFIGLILFFKLGWQGAINYHNIPRNERLMIPDNVNGVFYVLLLLDIAWLRSVAKRRLEEEKV